jgi:hypothetical protein
MCTVMAVETFVRPRQLFCFLILHTDVRFLRWGISHSQGRYIHAGQQTQNKHAQTPMFLAGFDPVTPMFEWPKTVHALGRAVTMIGEFYMHVHITYKGKHMFASLSSGILALAVSGLRIQDHRHIYQLFRHLPTTFSSWTGTESIF